MPRRADRGSQFISLGRVVQHDVQNDFNACAVKSLDHLSEFQGLPPMRSCDAVGSLRSEEGDRIVAPVVSEFFPGYRIEPLQFIFVKFSTGINSIAVTPRS